MGLNKVENKFCDALTGVSYTITPPTIDIIHKDDNSVEVTFNSTSKMSPPLVMEKYIVDWGDGNVSEECVGSVKTHTYTITGILPTLTVYAIDSVGNRSPETTAVINPTWRSRCDLPVLSVASLTMNEESTYTINIDNFNADYVYEMEVGTHFTASKVYNTINITSISIPNNVLEVFKIRAIRDGMDASNWVEINIHINKLGTVKPTVNVSNISVNENDSTTVTITNYDSNFTYELVNGSDFTTIRNNEVITVNTGEVPVDISEILRIRSTEVDRESSEYTNITINIVNVPVIDGQQLVYDSTNMTEFTTLTNASVINGELVATSNNAVAVSNIVTQEVGETDFVAISNIAMKNKYNNILSEGNSNNLQIDGISLVEEDTILVENKELSLSGKLTTTNIIPTAVKDGSFALSNIVPMNGTGWLIKHVEYINDGYSALVLESKYVNDEGYGQIIKYDLSNKFDLTSRTIGDLVVAELRYCSSFAMTDNGLLLLNWSNNQFVVYNYNFDNTNATYVGYHYLHYDSTTENINIDSNVNFNHDGSRLYFENGYGLWHQYLLTTPYSISTAIYEGIANLLYSPVDFCFNNDYTRCYFLRQSQNQSGSVCEIGIESDDLVNSTMIDLNSSKKTNSSYNKQINLVDDFILVTDLGLLDWKPSQCRLAGSFIHDEHQEIDITSLNFTTTPIFAYKKPNENKLYFNDSLVSEDSNTIIYVESTKTVEETINFTNLDLDPIRTLRTKIQLTNKDDKFIELTATI